ncbi:uncharacterized protein ACLA_007630 [Aspergillus clavatus NRRL 1]|uniref:STEEP1 domain-containing protein n=1 Tax=Aspergillus clavatus (strain ATCC 1007 / CBS 513.65 / DSM 816 / NCTC 3887 / NRRL 1 / QM 1276 / 107) TaxID=344612 RepID=A1CDS7_ASPCL|nr:uncharacterized protein ACLA_007630 [Aspergillus clavatus NRRL 1]EAW12004.1 conserved hypothetical protein [Aspergillus clavatus NRRL 1]
MSSSWSSSPPSTTTTPTLPIKTHHCRFCNHLLLATTRHLPSLPRRSDPARDAALILPLPAPSSTTITTTTSGSSDRKPEAGAEAEAEPSTTTTTTTTTTTAETDYAQPTEKHALQQQQQQHYTILLSTTVPDRKATLIRREDGFEKRVLLRCGRCRVVVGYFLDGVHFGDTRMRTGAAGDEGVEMEEEERTVAYLLPGALVETGEMGDEEVMRAMDREWVGWIEG